MSFVYLLLCVYVLFCGHSSTAYVLDNYNYGQYPAEPWDILYTYINKVRIPGWTPLKESFYFEEGSEYVVKCIYYDMYIGLHWEVEPYGLRSLTFISQPKKFIHLVLKLHRDDDQITVGCYANKTKEGVNKTTTFRWDKTVKPTLPPPPLLLDATNDAEQNCYQQDNTEKCAFLTLKTWSELYPLVELQIFERKNIKCGWVPVVTGFAAVALLLVLSIICYRFIRKSKQTEPTHTEPPIVYAEMQMECDGQRRRETRDGENSHNAKILWFKSKKNVPNPKNDSENTRSKTVDTRIGIVEQINDLYSTAKDTRIGTVEQINDLYSTAEDIRIYPNRK